ncbi:VC2046/SO_2500 family protein [Gallaecimonas sp. GXIMD1310]|uniref:VC2046/SO_2500 family protein n=1 Tax=Gallaecimonas sp. GXIMD1310 TaxID=3131926 RepID=UPI00324A246C
MQINGLSFQDELQLAPELASAVAVGERSRFALLLAMLGDDVLQKPGLASPDSGARPRTLGLATGPVRPLGIDARTPARSNALSEAFHQGGMHAARLFDCLDPEPVIDHVADAAYLPPQLLADLEPRAAKRARGEAMPAPSALTANADLGEVLAQMRQTAAMAPA